MLKSERCGKVSDSTEFHFKESYFGCWVGVLFILSGVDKKKHVEGKDERHMFFCGKSTKGKK